MNMGILLNTDPSSSGQTASRAAATFSDFFSNTENGAQFKAAVNLESAGSGLWYVLLVIGSFGLVFALMFAAIKIFTGTPQDRAMAKKSILVIMILAVLLFGVPFLVQIILTAAEGFN